ncbi:MAG: AraC family transcriptional regulator [Lentimicrobiaceae bacterium]|nr:AraC family transcriptional regulator [Lentimicrobiaceae bacterium]
MGFNEFILTVNTSSIIILLVLAAILLVATRFRGEHAYAAAIIVLPNVPVYLYNASVMLWHDLALFLFPISSSVNLLLMPLLWLFAKKSFDSSFRLKPIHLLHLLPALICLGLCLSMSPEERLASIRYEMTGNTTLINDINTIFVFIQMIAYFAVIFRFLHRTKKAIGDTLSDAEWIQKSWIPVFEYLFAALFVIVMVGFFISPSTGTWLIQILNVIAMFYLVYNIIAHPVMPIKQVPVEIANDDVSETVNAETPSTHIMDEQLMKDICESASQYMEESKAYLRPDISLAIFAKEINIPQRKLSFAINGYLKCNFFEFVNRMRIEEAKHLMQKLDTSNLNIDSIYADCGFRSRSTFYMVFKKMTGKTPVSWLEDR